MPPLAKNPDDESTNSDEQTNTSTPMEVHHHGHVHNDKKWKEYLFQFFMLFLAVFCGTLAEYQLEHIVEHHKEKQYIESFVENIRDDTTTLHLFIKLGKAKEKGLDSLLVVSKNDIATPVNRKLFYTWSLRTLSTIPTFSSNDATSSQLRNSGGYRLIQKKGAADSLTAYDQLNKSLTVQAGYYSQYFNQINSIWQEMVDLTVLQDTSYLKNGSFTGKDLPLILMDNKQKLLFNNKIIYFSGVLQNYDQQLKLMLDYATRLISYLQKTYNLDEKN